MGKLQLKTETRDKRENTLAANIRKVKNKSGVIETRIYTCTECSEEFCNGNVFFLILLFFAINNLIKRKIM